MSKQRVTKLGSNANNALNVEVTYWNMNNASSDLYRNISSHLALLCCLFPKRHRTVPLGKIQN